MFKNIQKMFKNLQKMFKNLQRMFKNLQKMFDSIYFGPIFEKLHKLLKFHTRKNIGGTLFLYLQSGLNDFLEVLKHFLRFLNIFWTFWNIF